MHLLDDISWTVCVLIFLVGRSSPDRAVSKNESSLNASSPVNNSDSTYRRYTDDYDQSLMKNSHSFGKDDSYNAKEFGKGKSLPASVLKHLPSRRICGPLSEDDRIFGGENTAIDEFPWLVRIKYILDSGKEVYACAGSLITDHYVLTAAHCAVNLTIKEVRLGDWNVETDYDCQDNVCSGAAVDIKVTRVIPFPGYNKMDTFKGDIALLRLQRPVSFTDFIRPICLPTSENVLKQDYSPGSVYLTAGWGKTEYAKKSPIKRKLALESVPITACRQKQPALTDDTSQFVICAGGKEGKDTCVGDSGGSLVKQVHDANSTNWFLVGVTSYGYKECGTEGRPGLYAKVTPYMDWILQNIV